MVLGTMGWRLAVNLQEQGFRVAVSKNREADVIARLSTKPARGCQTDGHTA